jgi:NAD+ synthase
MTSNSMNFESASQEIIDFIKKETEIRESKGIVLGMSGGIDSTVLAYLATRAIGSKNVKGLILPDESVTPPDDIEDALTICSILNIDYEKMSINKPKDSFLETIKYKNDTLLAGNLVARIRMCILYYYSGQMGRLVLGSSNKTELMLGYFTKFGDGAADLLPLGDLYKTQLFGLAKFLEIPESIIQKKSSARLWTEQFTEDELGLPFVQLDKILQCFEAYSNVSHDDIGRAIHKEFPEISPDAIQKIQWRIAHNQHKIVFPAICKISK